MLMTKTFKEFSSDFKTYYQVDYVRITDETDMQEVCYDLYGTDDFEVNYETKIIELFN